MKLFYDCIVALKAPCVYSNTCLEEFEDIKEVIKIRKSKDRQHNGQNEKGQKDKQRSTKYTHTNEDRVKRRVNPVTNPMISHE